MEPSLSGDPFEVSKEHVQNNRWFQNLDVAGEGEAAGGGGLIYPPWRWQGRRWVAYFVKSHAISFEQQRYKAAAGAEAKAPGAAAEAGEAAALPDALEGEREWTDVEGRRMRAALVKFADETKRVAVLKRSDGRVFEFPVERLSEKDRAFLVNGMGDGE